MPGRIVLPKQRINNEIYADWPVFFFAGPDLGGDDWQVRMFEAVERAANAVNMRDFIAAIPCRIAGDHPLRAFVAEEGLPDEPYQLGWERDWMRRAAWSAPRGCLMFWLPEESKTNPRADGQPYARDTRRECGEWSAHLEHVPDSRLAFGGEDGFPGKNVIVRSFLYATDGTFSCFDSIERTARHAVTIAKHGMAAARTTIRSPVHNS